MGSMGGSTPYAILRKRREEVFAREQLRREGYKKKKNLSSTPVLRQPLTLLLSPSEVRKSQTAEV